MLRSGLAATAICGALFWSAPSAMADPAADAAAAAETLDAGNLTLAALRANERSTRERIRAIGRPAAKAPAQSPLAIPPLPERKDEKAARAARPQAPTKGAHVKDAQAKNPKHPKDAQDAIKDAAKDAKSAPVAAAPPPPDVWQPAEIAAAKARCDVVLKKVDAVVEPQPPLKEGACGAPAPVRLLSLGKSPKVAFSPPALVDFQMVEALDTWISKEVQPLAQKHLNEKVVTVEVMSDYSCRTAFGRVGHKLSQHAFADALDIRGFVTASGKKAHVLDAWGITNRELVAQAAAAKKLAELADSNRADAGKAKEDGAAHTDIKADIEQIDVADTASFGAPDKSPGKERRTRVKSMADSLPDGGRTGRESLKLVAAKLGGPKPPIQPVKEGTARKLAALAPPPAAAAPITEPRARFLRAVHAAACRIFGTTLGPEANEAHRNHLHVDMAERKYKKICD
jgi:hypothetical protein